jgi:hypothetical protein
MRHITCRHVQFSGIPLNSSRVKTWQNTCWISGHTFYIKYPFPKTAPFTKQFGRDKEAKEIINPQSIKWRQNVYFACRKMKTEIKTYSLNCRQIHEIVEEWQTNLMSLVILFHFLCTQHVSDINISVIRSLRLCCWITTSVVLLSVLCVLEIWCGWFWVVLVLQASACKTSCIMLYNAV